ncbi:hypothetical protein STA3757_32960 [Stanieria sp. NIES-3757]|nr:hypothetical protein STA3757_32960 [Stanieria sp. NIES-3757]
MANNTESPPPNRLKVVHLVKGRMRCQLVERDDCEILFRVAHHLRQQLGVASVQIKEKTGNLVVNFNSEILTQEKLIDLLQPFGLSQSEGLKESVTEGSQNNTVNINQLLSLLPPISGLILTRRLGVTGWKSIATYILTTGIIRQVIEPLTPEKEKSASDLQNHLITMPREDISTLLAATETDYQIVHQIPGRVRLRIDKIGKDSNYAQALNQLLKQNPIIKNIRINQNNSSVTIIYDRNLAESNGKVTNIINHAEKKTEIIEPIDESNYLNLSSLRLSLNNVNQKN